jgi:dephospho-CoA kinase
MKRDNIDKDLALKKINSQMDTKERIKRSDYTIESCVDFNKTIENIENVLERI